MEDLTTQKNRTDAVVTIQSLKKAFGSKVVLSDISMNLYKGENLVILGKSGSGKSVTIKCIVRLLEQDAGSLEVFGKEVADLNERELKELRIKTGFLFQSAALYDSMTV